MTPFSGGHETITDHILGVLSRPIISRAILRSIKNLPFSIIEENGQVGRPTSAHARCRARLQAQGREADGNSLDRYILRECSHSTADTAANCPHDVRGLPGILREITRITAWHAQQSIYPLIIHDRY